MRVNESIVTRLRSSFAAREEARTATDECPDARRIWDAANGRLDSKQTRRMVDHFVLCPSCAADWRIAMPFESKPDTASGVSRSRRRGVYWTGLAAAAAVLAVAVVGLYQLLAPPPTAPVYRATDSVIRSAVAEQLPLSREQAILRWTRADEDALYSVEVGKTDLTPIATARDLTEPEFRIPPEALAELETGEAIVWQVEALLPDGRRVVSEAFVNRVE